MNIRHASRVKASTTKLFLASAMGLGVIILSTLPARAAQVPVYDYYGNNGAVPDQGGMTEWNLYNSGTQTPASPAGYTQHPGTGIMEYLYGTQGSDWTRLPDADVIDWVGSGTANAIVKYSGDSSETLYTTGLGGGNKTQILSVSAFSGTPSISGSSTTISSITQPFLFLDQASRDSDTPNVRVNAFSDPSLTTDLDAPGTDGDARMIAFAVYGYLATPGDQSTYTLFSGGPDYVLGFEDGTDFDYQDLVVQVSGVEPLAFAPDGGSTMALMGTAMLALGALRRKLNR